MNEQEDFLRGLCAGSGLEPALAVRAYGDWLKAEGYAEVQRIDLEGGGYDAGVEVGKRLAEKTN